MYNSDNPGFSTPGDTTRTSGDHKIALVVGINNSKASSHLETLRYAEEDAYEVYRILRQNACGFNYIDPVLTGEKAVTGNVRSAIIRLVAERTEQDFLLFYFIGHAQPVKMKDGQSDIYLVTYDFNPGEVKVDPSAHLSLSWLRKILYQSNGAGKILIILDCCYAGNMIEIRPDEARIHVDINVDVRKIVEQCLGGSPVNYHLGRLRVILTATGYNTPAAERVMTSLVLSVLQGKEKEAADQNGDVNIHSLYLYLQSQMPLEQLPNLSGDFPRTCILARHPHLSEFSLYTRQKIEENALRTELSALTEKVSEVSRIITEPDYFWRLAQTNSPLLVQPFDQLTDEGSSTDDLNQEKIVAFFERDRVQIQDDFLQDASTSDQLRDFGFIQGSHPSYGALLCFGQNPTRRVAGAFVRCTVWSGNDRHAGWEVAQDYQRDLITQFESSRDFLRKHLRLIRTIGRDERTEELEIPLVALGEALANALVHRKYANQTSPVYVDIFKDRVEICSPGTPPAPMTLELLEEKHISHPRNPQIARIFYLCKYVDKVGSGIQRMQDALVSAGLRPAKFELGKDKTLRVIFSRPERPSEEAVTLAAKETDNLSVFCSYASADRLLRDRLGQYLQSLQRQGIISDGYDRQIDAGTNWRDSINTHLMTASVILLLISPDFLASDYCYSVEVQQALERHNQGEARVIPIILRPVLWQGTPFGKLQCLPRSARPVTTWSNQDEAFLDVINGIHAAIKSLRTSALVTQHSTLPVGARLNRQRLLERVNATWITGVLQPSLYGAALISLGLREQPEIISNPWRLATQETDQPAHLTPAGTRITQVYAEADGELLILGEPGAGKTTLLLELARDLLERAQQDETCPMPVVFNLVSWAVKRQPIADWLIEELNTKYQVAPRLAQSWVDTDQILLLLDGLDEVPQEHRAACIEAINLFQRAHLVPLGVCRRSADYLAQRMRLGLRSAVVIQPLTREQIDTYLSSAGEQLAGLRVALSKDQALQELATTPLMLSILMLTYQRVPVESFSMSSSSEIRRQVFSTYLQRMLQRRSVQKRYTQQQTVRWLVWLAQQMTKHNQTEFSIKQMQPDWLPEGSPRRIYHMAVGIIFAIAFGVLFGLGTGLLGGLIVGIICGLIVALIFGVIFGTGLIRNTIIQRFVLRVLLWQAKLAPLSYRRFLDYATERLLLRKGEDTYFFAHPILLDFFATLESDVSSDEE